jgi:hypothetical protein
MRIKPYRKAHSRRGCERAIFVTRKSLTSGTKREIYSCATFVPSPRSCVAAQGSYNSERCSGTQPLIVVSFCAAFRTTAPTAVASSAVGRHPNPAQLQKWKSPAKDMGDLITWLKANPNRALVPALAVLHILPECICGNSSRPNFSLCLIAAGLWRCRTCWPGRSVCSSPMQA